MSKFLPFGEALAVARSLNLASSKEWNVWCKGGMCPPKVPHCPHRTFKGGEWQGWGHWLGTGNVQLGVAKQFLPFSQALAFARSLGLGSEKAWRVWRKEGKRPANVPSSPEQAYKDGGWQGWGHWLGTGNTKSHRATVHAFLPFAESLAVAQSLGLANRFEWKVWCKEGMRPPKVPADPSQTYKDGGWQGWGHWLGTGNTKNHRATVRAFLPFAESLAVAQSLGLANMFEWREWCKEGMCPPTVPRRPDLTYKDGGWQGWGHWLGTGNQSSKAKKTQFLPFHQALRTARHLRLVSVEEWRAWCRSGARPSNVPACPEKTYVHDGWMGWEHWLHHANLDVIAAPAAARLASKHGAPGRAGTAPGQGGGKRQRR